MINDTKELLSISLCSWSWLSWQFWHVCTVVL